MHARFKHKKPFLHRSREFLDAPIHAVAHHKRGIALHFSRFRAAGLGAFSAFLAVLGPGLLAGLSDDDPAGITTYSVLGADHGYRLLWIIPASTILLIISMFKIWKGKPVHFEAIEEFTDVISEKITLDFFKNLFGIKK